MNRPQPKPSNVNNSNSKITNKSYQLDIEYLSIRDEVVVG